MITEIFVENRRVDISADISSLLTFAIDDLKNFGERTSTFSKTIILPGTANNNALFGSIFEMGSSNTYDPTLDNIGSNFNASITARCLIFQDNLQTFKGTLRILKVITDKGRVEFEVALNGEIYSLSVALGSGYLTDLDFSEYDETYSVANIESSWDQSRNFSLLVGINSAGKTISFLTSSAPTPYPFYVGQTIEITSGLNIGTYTIGNTFPYGGYTVLVVNETVVDEVDTIDFSIDTKGRGLYYPLIDYGGYGSGGASSKLNWEYGTFRPALYVREYIDKMFEAANFRYDCDLFNTERFKGLIVPQNKKQLVKQSANDLDVSGSALTYTGNTDLPFATQTTLGNFTAGAGDDDFTYNSATTINGTMYLHLEGNYTKPSTSGAFQITILKNGVPFAFSALQYIGLFSTAGSFDVTIQAPGSIAQNDVITVQLFYNGTTGTIYFGSIRLYFTTGAVTFVPINIGETIPVNDSIPQNIRQIDFLTSVVKLFNLYVYEDRFDERLVHITPYPDFYSESSSNSVDWTYKMNRDKPKVIEPMSELNSRIYKFAYREDSDFYNAEYKKRYNEGYGSYAYDSNYAFSNGTNTLELIFAGTPLVGYNSEDKVFSTILKKSNNAEENTDSVIRILQTKKITGVTSWDILDDDGVTVLDSYTKYGYAGHLDDPDNPTNDLNFGVLKELFFTLVTGDLTVTQFNVYYSAYMAELTDKDSRLLTAYFYLTPKDIFELDFSKYVYVDGDLYRLMKITDYNASVPGDCKVELLKVINTLY